MPSFFRGNDSHGPRIHPQRVTLARSPNTFVDNSCGSVGKRCRMSVTIPSLGMNAVPMVSNPLGIAVVGCGYWGTNYVRIVHDLAESKSAVLMVGHTFVFNAGIQKVKEYVQMSSGRVYYLYARRTNLGPIRHDVNALWDLAPHDIAIFNYLLDSVPEWVSAVGGKVLRNCRDDVGFISLGYPGNIIGHVHVSWADPDKAREVVIVTSDRRIAFNDLNGLEQVRLFEKGVSTVAEEPLNYGEFRFEIRDGDIISPRIKPTEPLKNQCRHFLECVRRGKRPISSGIEGCDVVRVLEAVNRSIEYNGQKVEVEKDDSYA